MITYPGLQCTIHAKFFFCIITNPNLLNKRCFFDLDSFLNPPKYFSEKIDIKSIQKNYWTRFISNLFNSKFISTKLTHYKLSIFLVTIWNVKRNNTSFCIEY